MLDLPPMTDQQRRLYDAVRQSTSGYYVSEVFTSLLNVLSTELRHIAETDPDLARRNARRFADLLSPQTRAAAKIVRAAADDKPGLVAEYLHGPRLPFGTLLYTHPIDTLPQQQEPEGD